MFTKNYYRFLAYYSSYSHNSGKQVPELAYTSISGAQRSGCVSDTYDTVVRGFTGVANVKTSLTTSTWDGFFLGDGTKEPTLDDYNLSGNIITTVSQLSKTATNDITDTGIKTTITLIVQNTGTEAITISEIGWFGSMQYSTAYSQETVLFERSLLPTPITLEAGMSGQIDYVINRLFN